MSDPFDIEEVSSRVYPTLDRKPGDSNWVDAAGGLPDYIERIAKLAPSLRKGQVHWSFHRYRREHGEEVVSGRHCQQHERPDRQYGSEA